MSALIRRAQREPGLAAAYALGAASLLWLGGKALRKGVNRLFPRSAAFQACSWLYGVLKVFVPRSGVPGETNTALLATPVPAHSADDEELGDVKAYDYVIVCVPSAPPNAWYRAESDSMHAPVVVERQDASSRRGCPRIPTSGSSSSRPVTPT